MTQEDIKHTNMNEDLISTNFSYNINRKLIKRYIRMLFVLIALFLGFTILNFTDWYLAIKEAGTVEVTLFTTFHYKIQPVLIVIEAALAAISLNSYLKGQRSILLSLETENAELFNKGYKLLNEALVLDISGYCIIFLSLCYEMLLTYII